MSKKKKVSFEFQFARPPCRNIKNKKTKEREKNEERTQFFNADRSKRGIWFLKKKDLNGFSRRGISFVPGGIMCTRDANRHVADSEKATIAGLTNRKQNGERGEEGGIKRATTTGENWKFVILRGGNRWRGSHNGAGSGYNSSLVQDFDEWLSSL